MSDANYRSSSEEFHCGDPGCGGMGSRDESGGPPLPRDRFEQACLRIFLRGPLSLRVTVNFPSDVREVEEVVPLQRGFLHWEWDFLEIFRAEEARQFEELRAVANQEWAHRRVERLLRLGPGIQRPRLPMGPLPRMPMAPLPRLPRLPMAVPPRFPMAPLPRLREQMPPIGRGQRRSSGR